MKIAGLIFAFTCISPCTGIAGVGAELLVAEVGAQPRGERLSPRERERGWAF